MRLPGLAHRSDQRLAQLIDNVARKLGRLTKKEQAIVRERNLSQVTRGPPPTKAAAEAL